MYHYNARSRTSGVKVDPIKLALYLLVILLFYSDLITLDYHLFPKDENYLDLAPSTSFHLDSRFHKTRLYGVFIRINIHGVCLVLRFFLRQDSTYLENKSALHKIAYTYVYSVLIEIYTLAHL